ncbi:MAG: PAS domain-containing protein [Deltaproteobacteria bacterium]|nr:PAS domain-containing protein [Deltaproteobacteria bacterium]
MHRVLVVPPSQLLEAAARAASLPVEAATIDDAPEAAAAHDPAIVLLEVRPAEARALIAALRTSEPGERLYVAVGTAADAAAFREAGADDVIIAPLEAASVTAKLRLYARACDGTDSRKVDRALRAALAHARIGTYEVDLRTGHNEWSDLMHEILGVPRERFEGTLEAALRLLVPNDVEAARVEVRRTLEGGRGFSHELRVDRPGARQWLQGTGTVMRDARGNPVRLVGTVTDITERKAAELTLRRTLEEIRESDARFRVIGRATSDVVYDWDFATNVVTWNENLAKFGWEHHETPLSFWEEAIHPDDRARVTQGLASAVALGEETWTDEYRFRRGDGTWANVLDRGVVLSDDSGKPVRMIGAMMDITERRELQARLLLADRMASVGTLAAGVAHEINNPLAYVIANIDIASGEVRRLGLPSLGPTLDALAQTKEGASRVRRIVGDLKTFSRADDAVRERVDLRDVVESSINLAMNEIRHRAQLTRDLGPVPRVDANAGRLGQVAVNLLVNAAQAIPEGAADRNEIRVRTRTDETGRAVLEVEDTGPGMPPEIKHRIFDPFYTTKPIGEGTGLGLTICHGIVSGLGGTIEVESDVGAGSTFRVVLPPAAESERPDRVISSSPGAPVARRGRVLVIDDEPMIGKAVQLMLHDVHDVTPLVSAREALARLEKGERYDAIICDLMMPEMTGMDLHAEVVRRFPEMGPRFVFLTGGAFTARARAFLEQSPNPRLEKPFEAAALIEAIGTAIRRAGARAT